MAVEVLRMEGITKIYGNGFVANKNVTFWLNKGEILALVGENGAGKTRYCLVLRIRSPVRYSWTGSR